MGPFSASAHSMSNGHGPARSFSNGNAPPPGTENELWVGASDPRALAVFGLS
jgi:hypothetical protein